MTRYEDPRQFFPAILSPQKSRDRENVVFPRIGGGDPIGIISPEDAIEYAAEIVAIAEPMLPKFEVIIVSLEDLPYRVYRKDTSLLMATFRFRITADEYALALNKKDQQ